MPATVPPRLQQDLPKIASIQADLTDITTNRKPLPFIHKTDSEENLLKIKKREFSFKTSDLKGFAVLGCSLFLLMFQQYVKNFYPALPQEFGGVKPRPGYLQIKRAQVSQEVRNKLLPEDKRTLKVKPEDDITPVVQSLPVDIYYETSDAVLVKPHGASSHSPTYTIRRENVAGITGDEMAGQPVKDSVEKLKPEEKRNPKVQKTRKEEEV